MLRAAGLGQKHGKFPASETKEHVHGIKKMGNVSSFQVNRDTPSPG